MSIPKINVSTPLIGTTGYNNHAQAFFSALSKYVPLEIRNFTIGSSWKGMSDEPHNEEPYMNDTLKTLLTGQTLVNQDKTLSDLPIYTNWPNHGIAQASLVLSETNHHYFYQDYPGYKIAYNVWESTRQPQGFFNRLLEFDELWVPSKWQRDCSIKQGYPAEKITVIPEGIDTTLFKPLTDESRLAAQRTANKFSFFVAGRWEYRKATREIIKAFLDEFIDEPVELILSVDNQFANDGLDSTEARLKEHGLESKLIKVVHLPSREEYVRLIQESHVFVSCSRAEGWNLPLIEAMACGTPAIYSACSGQLEFAEGRGIPVRINKEIPYQPNGVDEPLGNYYEPDFRDLRRAMRQVYDNWEYHKDQAVLESRKIHELFNWDRVAKLAADQLSSKAEIITESFKNSIKPLTINYNFINGAHLEILNGEPDEFLVEFQNQETGKIEHSAWIKNNMWVKTNIQYFVNWRITVKSKASGEIVFNETLDIKDKRVLISIDSRSLGDTLAWFPAVEEFRKKHECEVLCSCFIPDLVINNYPKIKFVSPGQRVENIVASYQIGWFYDDNEKIKKSHNPIEVKDQPMQKCAFDILGLEYVETRPIIDIPIVEKKNQIAIAIHGTCQAKYWNNLDGWQEVVDWCNSNNYEVILVSKEENGFMGNLHPVGISKLPVGPLSGAIRAIAESKAFIGIGSGLSWLSWAVGTPTVLVSGFSHDYTETTINTYRVSAPDNRCSGCFNSYKLDPGDWNWCPVHKGTHRMFECSRSIKSESVISALKSALGLV